jgi:hypothetical protein
MTRKNGFSAFGTALLVALVSACGSSNKSDGGAGTDGSSEDTGGIDGGLDGGSLDVIPGDVGHHDGSTPDATRYCAINNEIDVAGTNVAITPVTSQPTSAGNAAAVSCIDQPPMMFNFTAPIYIRGCMTAVGSTINDSDVNTNRANPSINVAIFSAKTATGAVDPSFDPATGLDRQPSQRLPVGFSIDHVPVTASCMSGYQLSIGFGVALDKAIQSQTDYIIRVTSTSAASQIWAATYYYGVHVPNDDVILTGAATLGECDATKCRMLKNFNVFKSATLSQWVSQAVTPVPGATNLADGKGAGYGVIETYSCADLPMKNAVAGFSPVPLNAGYTSAGAFMSSLMASTDDGLFVALGFMGQTANDTASTSVTGAVGINRGGSCTEEFGGEAVRVFPDSISVIRSGKTTVLHNAH